MSEWSQNRDLGSGLSDLRSNEYPGRVAMMGIGLDGDIALQAYAIMGRSEESRDRIFVQDGTSIRTTAPRKTPEEMAATKNSNLIFYRALGSVGNVHVVSNGAQTDPILDDILYGFSLEEAARQAPTVKGTDLEDIDLAAYEPDSPNFTPRITGVIDLRPSTPTPFGLAVVSKNQETGEPDYAVYTTDLDELESGVGFGVQTYNGNGNPLPSFDREPWAIPFGRNTVDTAHMLWNTLNSENVVSLAVRAIDLETGEAVGTTIVNSKA
jgi:IMP cyclohydrolase